MSSFVFFFFFFNDTATTEIYPLSLHDALPIYFVRSDAVLDTVVREVRLYLAPRTATDSAALVRSEEHTSELQSRLHLVCRLLLEKKKKKSRKPLLLEKTANYSTTKYYTRIAQS